MNPVRAVWKSVWPPLVAVLFFLLAWEMAVDLFQVEKWILPSPSDIGQEAATGASGLWDDTKATLRLTLEGFAVGSVFGLLVAVLLHRIPFIKSALYPLLILSQNVPTIALGPLLMIWFGFGILPKLILITLVCFFPVAVATMDGLARTDHVMRNYMEMAGASKGQIFRKLEFPYAIPSLLSGLKISATYSVMGAIISEWLGAEKGIGYYMKMQKSTFRTDRVFVAILIIVAISLAMFVAVAAVERLLSRYSPPRKSGR
ncbi:ABC transporter permease [Paenibacillus pinistramenti]|uniref:ABC transporter permease n=1 Tax=Paenibacillus pinistramenti TaxID=1768003 RepID=UPI001108C089|nr:ABC transporter permease [Paenibacillus pinistramenti]